MRLKIGAAVLAAVASISAPAMRGSAGEPSLQEVRAATERFRDVKVALAEGYVRDPMNLCDTAPMMGQPAALGAMGVHFFRPDLLGISGPPNPRVDGNGTHTDFRKPAILIYEPQADGSLKLVAVENLVFQKSWHAAGNAKPPTSTGSNTTPCRTTHRRPSTRRICSSRITTVTSGSTATTRTACSPSSTRT